MSHTVEKLLIIYHTEAEQWAEYLRSVFTGAISEADICCYEIATASNPRDDFLRLARYSCKLLILSEGVLDSLGQMWRFFLARVLSPAAQVVVLLCGVETVAPLLELVPLNGDECLQISTEQDAHEYLASVMDIVRKGVSAANVKLLTHKLPGEEQEGQSTAVPSIGCRTVVIPSRVPSGSSAEVFLLLKKAAPVGDSEVEFAGETQTLRVKPVCWNDRTLCVNAPDFPPGNVRVTLYISGVPLSKAHLQFYSSMEEIARLLLRAADPVDFMCQALQVSSVDELDRKLSSMLLEATPTGGFPALQGENTADRELRHADVPTLLHFAARYGLKSVSSLLLQCPGAERALHTPNRRGQTPAEIARSRGHAELHVLLSETLSQSNPREENDDADVYEVMCAAGSSSATRVQQEQRGEDEREEVEDPYASLGVNDEYDTTLKATKAVHIANRSPAPTPRPDNHQVKDDRIPYITQVFQKKKASKGNAEIYSLLTKQARGREPSVSSTYDTLVPEQMHGLQQLVELRQRVKAGSLTVDEALERFSDWKSAEKDTNQKGKSSQLRDGILNSREDDNDRVYDKISIAHHAPSHTVNERRRGSAPPADHYYSNPLKVQHPNLFWKANKP